MMNRPESRSSGSCGPRTKPRTKRPDSTLSMPTSVASTSLNTPGSTRRPFQTDNPGGGRRALTARPFQGLNRSRPPPITGVGVVWEEGRTIAVRLVATSRLADGALLGRDVRTGVAEHAPLLRTGTVITPPYREALIRQGIYAVYVDDELSAGIEVPEVLTERTRNQAESALQRAYHEIPTALGSGETVSDKAIREMK